MPFTPFHFGPATIIKALAGSYFSFILFGFTQVIIDLETLYYLIQNETYVHRFLHTYLGATVVIIFSYYIGKPICILCIKVWNNIFSPNTTHWFHIKSNIKKSAALSGIIFGAYSHVFLDGLMHSDMRPFKPLSSTNNFISLITVSDIHLFCLITGLIGVMILFVIFFWNKWTYDV